MIREIKLTEWVMLTALILFTIIGSMQAKELENEKDKNKELELEIAEIRGRYYELETDRIVLMNDRDQMLYWIYNVCGVEEDIYKLEESK